MPLFQLIRRIREACSRSSHSARRFTTGQEIGTAICRALGLDPFFVEGLELHCTVTEMAKVQVTRLLSVEEGRRIRKIIEDYELLRREQARLP